MSTNLSLIKKRISLFYVQFSFQLLINIVIDQTESKQFTTSNEYDEDPLDTSKDHTEKNLKEKVNSQETNKFDDEELKLTEIINTSENLVKNKDENNDQKETYFTCIEDNIETNEEKNSTEELKITDLNNVVIAKKEVTSVDAHEQDSFNPHVGSKEESILNQEKNNIVLEG